VSETPGPILTRAEAPPEPSPKFRTADLQSPEGPALCLVCGMHHGSCGAEMRCLRDEVTRLRGELAQRIRLHGR
jgi:hypothetical protein